MAKKKAAEKEEPKVVAKCDNLYGETYSQSDIERMIITIRGVQVMIDRDLATVYGVTTSQLNQQVKRNIARFPANFRFQLTMEEMNNLKSQIVTSSWGGTRKLPYAFTEPGIAQLSSMMKSWCWSQTKHSQVPVLLPTFASVVATMVGSSGKTKMVKR